MQEGDAITIAAFERAKEVLRRGPPLRMEAVLFWVSPAEFAHLEAGGVDMTFYRIVQPLPMIDVTPERAE